MNMNKNKILLITAIIFVMLLGGAYVLYNKLSEDMKPDVLTEQGNVSTAENNSDPEPESNESSETQKSEASDFTVYDVEGNAVNLSDFKGKPTVVNFWASWCGPCKSEMPDFNEIFLELGDEVNFVIVNLTDGSQETVETASAYIQEQGYSFPVYYDTDYSAATAYGVSSVPVTYIIDKEGYLVAYAAGAIDKETLRKGINMVLQ